MDPAQRICAFTPMGRRALDPSGLKPLRMTPIVGQVFFATFADFFALFAVKSS
jgi:hypothetical protein